MQGRLYGRGCGRILASGCVFDIQHFCLDDGPGIRTVIFFKGCPLRCIWCHNPEGFSPRPEVMYESGKCTGCGRCAGACPEKCHSVRDGVHSFRRDLCSVCGKCTQVCMSGALRIAGRIMSTGMVMDEIKKDIDFCTGSGGGITLSGGEPLFQIGFAADILKEAKQLGINTCIETSGFVPQDDFLKAAALADTVLFDIKETDPELHRKFTGADNRLILDNLEAADRIGAKVILRVPVIPGCNDSPRHFSEVGKLAGRYRCVSAVEIEPYHPMGLSKYRSLGLEPRYGSESFMDRDSALLAAREIGKNTEKEIRIK